MSLLLDTCALLWFLSNDPKLSAAARAAIEEPSNVRWVSPASLIEIAIKVRIGKLPLAAPFGSIFPTKLTAADIHLLPLEPVHIEPLTTLPLIHKDPFDRLIAATALVEGLTVVSADVAFDAYGASPTSNNPLLGAYYGPNFTMTSAVPEPASVSMFAIGLAMAGFLHCRKTRVRG